MGRKAILTWRQEAAERRDFRATRGDPEVIKGAKHRRKRGGCKKARNDEHVWAEPEHFNFAVTNRNDEDVDLSYTIERCALCRKKRYLWK